MKVYAAFSKDYEHRRGKLMGMLVERRKDMRGQTQWESGAKWARKAFGHLVKDKKDLFIFPKEMEMNNDDERLLIEKGIFTREEFLEMVKMVDREIEKETSGIK